MVLDRSSSSSWNAGWFAEQVEVYEAAGDAGQTFREQQPIIEVASIILHELVEFLESNDHVVGIAGGSDPMGGWTHDPPVRLPNMCEAPPDETTTPTEMAGIESSTWFEMVDDREYHDETGISTIDPRRIHFEIVGPEARSGLEGSVVVQKHGPYAEIALSFLPGVWYLEHCVWCDDTGP